MKKIILFLTLICFIYNAEAQFPADTSYYTIPIGSLPTLPPLLNNYVDNSVPDPIVLKRITEYNADWDWYPIHDYAKIQPWNTDVSMYKFSSVALYDASTHQMIRMLPGNLYPSYWSNTNADLLYSFREDGEIKTYSVSNDRFQSLYQLSGYDVVKLGPGEGNMDKNDHYVALAGKKGIDLEVIVFDLQTHQTICTKTFAGSWGTGSDVPAYIDWVSVSQSGNYVGIMWNHNTTSIDNPFDGHYGVEIYSTSNMQFLRRIADYGNHGDFGYTPGGEEVFVQFWGVTGTINAYYLDRAEHFVVQNHPDFEGEGHISCRNLNRPGWAYVSIDETGYGVMVAVKLDTSQTIEYFGHHYSSSGTYNKSPMPVPSPFGDKLMFKSDFGNEADTLLVFSFEAQKANSMNITHIKKTNFKVFPNPTKHLIHFENKEVITEIRIYNTIGQEVMRSSNFNSNKIQLNLHNLPDNVYFIKIVNIHGKSSVHKIVKIL